MPKWLQWIVKNIVLYIPLLTGCIIVLVTARWFLREPTEEPLIGLITAVLGVVLIIVSGMAIKYGIATNSDQTQIYDAKNKLQDVSDKERPAMLNRIRSQYVENVLDAALHKNLVHELTGKQATDNLRVKVKKRDDIAFLDEIDIALMFEDANGRLLITGEPGGGKTTTLNQLAKALIEEAERDPQKPIPVIFNLSEWANSRKSIDEWMIDVLKDKHNVNIEGLAEYWVQRRHILPLLDGLDEVTTINDYRQKCLQAIRDYRNTAPSIQLVICCRKNEWDDLKQNKDDLPELDEAIEIQPLSDAQIREFLDKVELQGTPVTHIRKVLASGDPNWHELASIPLMLNVMIFAYADASPDEPIADKPLDELRKDIFDRYIERRFAPPVNDQLAEQRNNYEKTLFKGDRALAKRKSLKWLSWLAWQMDERDIKDFYIEDLQPWWLANTDRVKRYKRLSAVAFGLAYGLIVGLITGLIFGLGFGLTYGFAGLIFGLAYGLIAGLIIGLIIGLITALGAVQSYELKIVPVALLKWEINLQTLLKLTIILCYMMSFGLVVGLLSTLAFETVVLPFGLGIGLFGTSVVGLIYGLEVILVPVSVSETQKPNERIIRSRQTGWLRWRMRVLIWLIFGTMSLLGLFANLGSNAQAVAAAYTTAMQASYLITSHIAFETVLSPIIGVISLSISLFLGLVMATAWGFGKGEGWRAVLQHIILRRLLKHEDRMPTNYADFLNYAGELRLLVRVGGGFKFLHGLLQEHFADMYRQNNPDAEIVPKPEDDSEDTESEDSPRLVEYTAP